MPKVDRKKLKGLETLREEHLSRRFIVALHRYDYRNLPPVFACQPFDWDWGYLPSEEFADEASARKRFEELLQFWAPLVKGPVEELDRTIREVGGF